MLKDEYKVEHVYNSSDPAYADQMKEVCKTVQPSVCLECIGGNTVSEMLDFMGINATVILYGYLSETPCGNINPLVFLQKNQTIESFLLGFYMAKLGAKEPQKLGEIFGQAQQLCTSDLKTEIHQRFGLHQIHDAIKFYKENQTAGKVLLRPDLTQ